MGSLLKTILEYGEKNFVDKDINNDTAAEMFLHNIHPKQIVLDMFDIPFMFYEVSYEYTTARGNYKQGKKYFVLNTYSPQENMKKELENYIKEFNKKNPQRQLLNVKFLESKCLGYVSLSA
ncbi:hypothetical protein [Clostridium felsineum]|uniref:Uncharacterized protein n=1 Tax=Clostridium felsineum TaxID=36839 RepID=A0A1S8MDW9_9CLOT|nr:hypothetical protein [Clostridium felsineum]URZ06448.1 hypothetical protein CLROS_017810 [Clostridium felsineum]URZ11483.1 hypothetical protein CROST_022000 [Clostridium felsineum]